MKITDARIFVESFGALAGAAITSIAVSFITDSSAWGWFTFGSICFVASESCYWLLMILRHKQDNQPKERSDGR